ncbi:hypothetical protein LCGC14_0181790 [marine sediment metagenome]|uniref:Enoyl reductase (ER) domain-containing protein n=1 Tax=marine sediment metagenome TaxID=412755 RepID=A0A0F9UPP0_9ZZZZ|nr:hypothetical protein [Phycisphaerae bacterium]HDZ42538.1 hypothetical protein [Phycisphaerae bacterium]
MKAALLEQLGSLTVREVADPEVGPYGALCQMLYGATCTGTDLHLIEGRVDWAITAAPTIIGHESIGRVIDVGNKVRNLKVGDMVTRVGAPPAADGSYSSTWGGFAELGVACDHWAMKEDGVAEDQWSGATVNQIIPAEFDPRACTMMTTWRETLSYITRMGLATGNRVLILGSGGVGLAFAAHAANLGAVRVAMCGSAARKEVAKRAGVTDFYDYKADGVGWIIASMCPEGFDIVIDAVGSQETIDLALFNVMQGGSVGIYGIDEMGKTTVDPDKARAEFTEFDGGYDEAETHERVVGFMQTGKLDAGIWLDLDTTYPLDEINAAFDAVRNRQCVKALVKLSDG